jgi:ribosomal protein S18 acetylase RimI-like enzyme
LRCNPHLNLYALGDLDDFFWPHTTWYGWADAAGTVDAIALLFTGLELPCFLALCDDANAAAMRALVAEVAPRLPGRVYCHLSRPVAAVLAERYRLDSHGVHLKMGLRDWTRLEDVSGRCGAGVPSVIQSLTAGDREEIEQLYAAAYPGNWFEAATLATGQYLGLRVEGRLAAIAGVHVYSPAYRVAALGNITTHPAYRGHGHATQLTGALCRQLRAACDYVGLNVKADNAAAIRCYEKLGFAAVGEYEEFMAVREGQRACAD